MQTTIKFALLEEPTLQFVTIYGNGDGNEHQQDTLCSCFTALPKYFQHSIHFSTEWWCAVGAE